ncbi:CLUMA_CG002829, isoform A [Clunio marinus]|uniref:CLUMA_CG002829, isoform A n=1 Tax=Clunio marinus TaxID=568069 RepID=A0A1J1HND3_9DIPT|nr:CLUMA_CG002829, isoform A [Clunio marinus]
MNKSFSCFVFNTLRLHDKLALEVSGYVYLKTIIICFKLSNYILIEFKVIEVRDKISTNKEKISRVKMCSRKARQNKKKKSANHHKRSQQLLNFKNA